MAGWGGLWDGSMIFCSMKPPANMSKPGSMIFNELNSGYPTNSQDIDAIRLRSLAEMRTGIDRHGLNFH
jgi:hypothetical protein